jgi:PAS domain S-box-containing protein
MRDGLAHSVEVYELKLNGYHDVTVTPLYDSDGKMFGSIHVAHDITALKRAGEALRKSETMYRSILTASPDDITITDLEGTILMISPKGLVMFGYQREEDLLGRSVFEFIVPEDRNRASVDKLRMLQGTFTGPGEYRAFRADGSVIVIEGNGDTIIGTDGLPESMIFAIRDITERKQAEDALQESETFLRETQTIAGLGSYVLDVTSGLWKSSEVLDAIFGINKAYERSFAGWKALIHPDDQTMMDDYFRCNVLGKGQSFNKEYRIIRHNDQAERWVHGLGKLVFDGQGRPVKMNGTIQDITERKQVQIYGEMGRQVLQILNESETFQDSIQRVLVELKTHTGFDAVGIRLQDGEDYPYFAEKGFPKDFLLKENTLIDRTSYDGVCRTNEGNVSLECTCGLVISGKTDPVHPLFTPGGSFWTNDSFPLLDLPPGDDPRHHPRNTCIHEGYASFALVPIRNKDTIVGLIQFNDKRKGRFTLYTVKLLEGIAAHIGEAMMRKRAEEELQKKDAEIKQFIYAVSHDLRSPLVTVKTFMGYLEKDMAEGNQEQLTQDIQYIHGAADKMKLRLDELLEFSRIGRVESPSTRVSLKEVLAEALAALAGVIKERKAEIHLPESDLILHGDHQRLCQLWQNLIENAVKYTRDGTIPSIELGVHQENGSQVFFIKDNGIGIDPQYHSKVFGLFEKLDPKTSGVGLGLSMIQRIVEKSGGRIWVESEGSGKGACFYFTLPKMMVPS